MKRPITIATIWFALLWVVFVFATPVTEALSLFDVSVRWGVFLAGCVIATIALATLRRSPRRGGAVLAICLVGGTLFFSVGFDWGRYLLFQIRRPAYERHLSRAKELGHVPRGLGHTEVGPPKLYAFYWQRGVVDNWSGVVYDPSGRIARINDARGWDEIRAHELSGLFGGTYYRCQSVGSGWYICWFT